MKKMVLGAMLSFGGLFTVLTIMSVSFMKNEVLIDEEFNGMFFIAVIFIIAGLTMTIAETFK